MSHRHSALFSTTQMLDLLANSYIAIPLTLTIGVLCGWFLRLFLVKNEMEKRVSFLEDKLRLKADEAFLAKSALEKARFGLNSLPSESFGSKPDFQVLNERNAEIILLKAEVDLLKSNFEVKKLPSAPVKRDALQLIEKTPKSNTVRQAVKDRLAALNRKYESPTNARKDLFQNEDETQKVNRKIA